MGGANITILFLGTTLYISIEKFHNSVYTSYIYEVYVNSYFDTVDTVVVNIHVVVVAVVSIVVVVVVACIDTGM